MSITKVRIQEGRSCHWPSTGRVGVDGRVLYLELVVATGVHFVMNHSTHPNSLNCLVCFIIQKSFYKGSITMLETLRDGSELLLQERVRPFSLRFWHEV